MYMAAQKGVSFDFSTPRSGPELFVVISPVFHDQIDYVFSITEEAAEKVFADPVP